MAQCFYLVDDLRDEGPVMILLAKTRLSGETVPLISMGTKPLPLPERKWSSFELGL